MSSISSLKDRLQGLRRGFNRPDEDFFLKQIDTDNIPEHIAFIMDGNGRWAAARGLPRIAGHKAGTETIRTMLMAAREVGVKFITLYAFSMENWARPKEEVAGLMELFVDSLIKELGELDRSGVRIMVTGRIDELPAKVGMAFEDAVLKTRENKDIVMVLALNYGGRAEICDAAKKMLAAQAEGAFSESDVDEESFRRFLYLPEVPDPALVIRTSGEYRVSNFLLWEIAYAEFYITKTLWPDFSRTEFFEAMVRFQQRNRRFGGL